MSSLLETQRAIRRALCGETSASGVTAVAELPGPAVSIHRNNTLHALTRALALGFPAVERMLGPEFFEAMAATFVRRTQPRSAWLDAYGDDFPPFIETFGPARALPYLADLARLEWSVAVAARTDPLPVVAPADLAGPSADDAAALRFEAHPSLQLLASPFPVDSLRRAALAADATTLQELDPNAPVYLLVRAAGETGDAEIVRLDEAAFRFTRLLLDGACLGEALQRFPDQADGRTLALHLSGASFRRARATPFSCEEHSR